MWALLALVAVLPWLGLLGHDRHLETGARSISFADVARTRIGWAMALFFGLQSLQAYSIFGWFAQLWRDSGLLRRAGRAPGRDRGRRQHPAVTVAARRLRHAARTSAA